VKLGSTLAYTSFYGVGDASILGMNRIGRDYLPRFKLQSMLSWFRAPWSAGLTHNYISAHGDLNRGSRIEYDPHSFYGATVSRSFRREVGGWLAGTRLMLGVDNLFDRDPPLYRSEKGYWAAFARRPAGRFFYAEVKKTY
jgi:outer membrane receptor protein involved in Fe transport